MTENESTIETVNWWGYVQRITDGATNAEIASKIGVTGPSVGRWRNGSNPDPTTAATLAREYGRPVLEAFIAAGYLTAEEAGEKPAGAPVLAQLDDDELLAEVASRMRGAGDAGTKRSADKFSPPSGEDSDGGGSELRSEHKARKTIPSRGRVTYSRDRKRPVRGRGSGDAARSRSEGGNGAKGES